MRLEKFDSATKGFTEVIESLKKEGAEAEPMLARVYVNLGWNYSTYGHELDAEKCFEASAKLNAKCFGPRSTQRAWSLMQLAGLHYKLGQLIKAKDEIAIAVSNYEASSDPENYWLARCYELQGQILQDPKICIKGMSILESSPSREYASIARMLIETANLFPDSELRLRESYLARASAIRQRMTLKSKQTSIDRVLFDAMGNLYQRENNLDLAESAYKKSLEINESYNRNSLTVIQTLDKLSIVLITRGKQAEAATVLERLVSCLEKYKIPFDERFSFIKAIFQRDISLLQEGNKSVEAFTVKSKERELLKDP